MFKLRENDLPILCELEKEFNFICVDEDGEVWACENIPHRRNDVKSWVGGGVCKFLNGFDGFGLKWKDEPLNIAAAIAQIKAQKKTAQTPTTPPLTWNERINLMTAEEKIEFSIMELPIIMAKISARVHAEVERKFAHVAPAEGVYMRTVIEEQKKATRDWLNSPCEGWEKE